MIVSLIKRALPNKAKTALRQVYQASRQALHASKKTAQTFPLQLAQEVNRIRQGKGKHLMLGALTQTHLLALADAASNIAPGALSCLPLDEAWKHRSPFLITANLSDIHTHPQNAKHLSRYRTSQSLMMVSDPRQLLIELHSEVHEYAQAADQSFFVKNEIISFSHPGLLMMGQKLLHAAQTIDSNTLTFNPITGTLHASKSLAPWSAIPLQSIEDIRLPVSAPWWSREQWRERVLDQLATFPELEDLCQALGYDSTPSVLQKAGVSADDKPWAEGTIIAFHTDDTVYTAEAERYANRLKSLGLRHHIQPIPRRENWVAGCAAKPGIIQHMRRTLTGPLLYTDVDAYLHTNPWPKLRPYRAADMAAYIDKTGELQSGTIYIGDTHQARELIDQWVDRQQKNPTTWDQRTLQHIIEQSEKESIHKRKWRFERLSPRFTFIYDRNYPFLYGLPIIEHLQASREQKTSAGHASIATRRARISSLFGNM